jgi:pimeloyl-ACP methyl ester carboxylesterase
MVLAPRARVIDPHAGHMVYTEAPDVVNAVLRDAVTMWVDDWS